MEENSFEYLEINGEKVRSEHKQPKDQWIKVISQPESPMKPSNKELIACKSDLTKITKKRTLYLKTEKRLEKKDIEPKIEILNPPFIDYS